MCHCTLMLSACVWFILLVASFTGDLQVPDFELPLDWTIETWVYPLNATTGTYFLSFATETNNNCFVVKSWFWDEPRQWYHVVFTWDGVGALIYVNGTLQESFRFAEFCGQYRGSLSLGQEQDSVGGTFDANQSPAMILDTVAVYSRAWSQEKVEQREDSPCVNLGDADLYALYTGFSRGKDLVGSQDGSVTASEILTPGQALTDSYKYWSGEIDFAVDSCAAAQKEAGAVAPSYDTSIVGGVGWDFNGDTTAYYFITQNDFVLPEEFTIEFWMLPRRTKGYVMSWASSDNQNCLLLRNDRISMLNSWHHIVVTVSKNAAFDYTTTVYVNGTVSNFLHSSFCGNHTGALALAQEQDAVGGRFDPNQATDAIIDTLAIYSTAWDASRVGTDRTVGVDLQATDLYALYSGYTKGQDLVGHQDGILWISQFGEGMYNSDANVNTLDMLSPYSVGGVAWDFPAGSVDYYLQTRNMTLPTDGWAIEMWVSLNSLDTTGYFLSYCVTAECNCLITTMAGFTTADVGEWRHFVVTYDPDTQSTYAYLDGVENADFVHVGFCGDAGPGTLSVAQEQDVQGGAYELVDAADIIIDTIAIYDTYWTSTQVNNRKGQCVNLHDTSLFTLWSGYTRGKDLVGFNDASMSIYDWAEGASLACDTFN